MLPKSQRVRRTDEFDEIFRNGTAVHGRLLSLRYAPAPEPKAGFVVSAKAVGNAVARNHLKRRLREIVRPQLSELSQPVSLVLIAKPPAARAERPALEQEVSALFKKATLVR